MSDAPADIAELQRALEQCCAELAAAIGVPVGDDPDPSSIPGIPALDAAGGPRWAPLVLAPLPGLDLLAKTEPEPLLKCAVNKVERVCGGCTQAWKLTRRSRLTEKRHELAAHSTRGDLRVSHETRPSRCRSERLQRHPRVTPTGQEHQRTAQEPAEFTGKLLMLIVEDP